MSDYTDYIHLLTILEPEEIVFKFNGTLGRYFLNWIPKWIPGTWIVTNRRLIFLCGNAVYGGTDFSDYLGRRPAYIFLFAEIDEVIKKKKNILIKYNTGKRNVNLTFCGVPLQMCTGPIRERRELRIGFPNGTYVSYQNYEMRPVDVYQKKSILIDLLYEFLMESITKKDLPPTPKPSEDLEFCPHCNKPLFNECYLCQYKISKKAEEIQCPICQNYFHRREFLEWIKIHGQCPNCHYKLNQHALLNAIPANIKI